MRVLESFCTIAGARRAGAANGAAHGDCPIVEEGLRSGLEQGHMDVKSRTPRLPALRLCGAELSGVQKATGAAGVSGVERNVVWFGLGWCVRFSGPAFQLGSASGETMAKIDQRRGRDTRQVAALRQEIVVSGAYS